MPTAGEQAAIGTEEFTKQLRVTKQRERRVGADVPGDVAKALGPEHDGAVSQASDVLEMRERASSDVQQAAST